MNRVGEKYLRRLERRAAHLEERIRASLTKDLTYDKAELEAIRWVVRKLEQLTATKGEVQ